MTKIVCSEKFYFCCEKSCIRKNENDSLLMEIGWESDESEFSKSKNKHFSFSESIPKVKFN